MPRRRLLDRLEGELGRRLTLVSAPAGFGKTTLLSEWHEALRGRETSLAWVLLDEHDGDPVLFWSYVIAAIERARPGVGEGARALLHALSPPGSAAVGDSSKRLQGVLTALINQLSGAEARDVPPGRLVLALDDYHTIQAQAIHDSLAFLLEYLPEGVHVVILTRADPPLPLARLRAQGHLLELRAADLRFSAEEVTLFLNRLMALDLSPDALATLHARTEGWPAGLQLAALSLLKLEPQQSRRFVEAFAGTHRHVLDYLTEEVLLRQAPEVQRFLLHTSILPYLSAPLCDAVNDRPGSQPVLEQLARDNLFLTPLDAEGRWYRYHPLFADVLRARLEQSSPGLLPALHRRAAGWHEGQGALAPALPHALAAGDPAYAAQLVETGYKRLAMRGELVTLRKWLDSLPAPLLRSRPRLCLARALALAYSGTREQVEGWLRQAEAALGASSGAESADAVRGEIASFQAVFASVSWAGQCSLELSQRALRLLPEAQTEEDLWLRVLTLQALGNCHRLQGQVREAEETYAAVLASAQELASPFLIQAVRNRLGQSQMLHGRLRQAAQTFADALRQAEDRGGELLWFAGELHAHLGQIYTEWDQLERALEHARRGIELGRQADNHHALLEGYLTQATVQTACRQTEEARRSFEEARRLAHDARVPYLELLVTTQRTWLGPSPGSSRLLSTEAREWAEAWAVRRRQAECKDLPLVLCEFQDLVLARLWLGQGKTGDALALLDEIEAAAGEAGRTRPLLQALALRALALQEEGHAGPAQDLLARVLALAEPEGYARTFLDAGEPMRRLVAAARSALAASRETSGTLLAYADRLLAAFPQPVTPRPAMQEPLTRREAEILTLVAGGASNQEIAERLVLTVGTVKGHVNHILDKLGARNRTEAAARARDLGLLDS